MLLHQVCIKQDASPLNQASSCLDLLSSAHIQRQHGTYMQYYCKGMLQHDVLAQLTLLIQDRGYTTPA